MYSLEYGKMVHILRQLRSSGEFHADVAPQPSMRQSGRVVLLVQNGMIVSCFIFDLNGQKLYHDAEAQRLLPALGILDWKLVTSTGAKTAASAPSGGTVQARSVERNALSIPQRLGASSSQMQTWSTLERSVYFLVDGTRGVEQIAKLLGRPAATIEQIIRTFEASGLIARFRES